MKDISKRINHRLALVIAAIASLKLIAEPALLGQTLIGVGHVDIGVGFEGGKWDLHIHNEEKDEEYEPDEGTLAVRYQARTVVPDDARFSFLGAPGAPVWVLSQVEDESLLFLGLAAEEIEKGVFVNDRIRMTLKGVNGPGDFFLYSTSGVTGDPEVRMNSRDGVSDTNDFAVLVAGGHGDYNWAFNAPGAYTITFEASGTLADGNQAVSSGSVDYTFLVEPTPGAAADIVGMYVGIDSLPRVRFGTYAGLPNPNQGRLVFLYAHVTPENILNSQYHAIGTYEYTGPTNAPVVVPTNSNNRIPETFTLQAPITLVPGSGRYEGKLMSAKTDEPFSDLRIRSVHSLRQRVTHTATNEFGFGSPQHALFYSNAGGRTNSLDHVILAMELVDISPGLRVGSPFETELLTKPGDRVVLGDGNSFEFQPVVWTEANTPPGQYSVRFKLVDMSSNPAHQVVPESGIITLDFQVAPPPTLAITKTVTLSLPVVTEGNVVESAPSVTGPWTEVDLPFDLVSEGSGEAVRITGKTLTVPLTDAVQFFRLRKL